MAIFDCNAHVSAALYVAWCVVSLLFGRFDLQLVLLRFGLLAMRCNFHPRLACNHAAPACILHLLQFTFVLFEILLGLGLCNVYMGWLMVYG